MHVIRNCPSCGTETRCSRREFSEQAFAVLLIWGEIEESVVDQPVCQSCYEELRDILIDRAGEIEYSLKNPKSIPKQPSVAFSKSASVAKKVEVPKEVAHEPKKTATAATKKISSAPTQVTKKADKSKKTKKVSRLAS